MIIQAMLLAFTLPLRTAELPATLTRSEIAAAAKVAGLDFTETELSQMLKGLNDRLGSFAELRSRSLPNSLQPALVFDPRPPGFVMPVARTGFRWEPSAKIERPVRDEDLAFLTVTDLSALLRLRKVTSLELTELALKRLKQFGPALHCVVGLTEDRALTAARRADAEIGTGIWRGPLHGIPFGAKDLLDVADQPATWGIAIRTNEVSARDATVIRKLEQAGAVLVARLSLGELAMGDTWFGGLTRNPWKPASGSSGSSAGSAAAVAAGLLPFAIGSETLGSIVSPATVCGVTGLRPTFGRVSRAGAMTLCYSLDKLGPLARSAMDCALVFEVIRGSDAQDRSVIEAPFDYASISSPGKLRVGYLKSDFEKEYANKTNDLAALDVLRNLGIDLKPIALPKHPRGALYLLLNAEAAASFDELTRNNLDDSLVQQGAGNWPNLFRSARLLPAVEYLQANRVRMQLMLDMAAVFDEVDVLVAPSWNGNQLLYSNMTGHPCVVVPNGGRAAGETPSLCFLGKLFGEADAIAVAELYQRATTWHSQHPDLPRVSDKAR